MPVTSVQMNRMIFLFTNTRAVVKAESICKKCGFAYQVIPVPRTVSSDCAMAISVGLGDYPLASEELTRHGITFQTWEQDTPRQDTPKQDTPEHLPDNDLESSHNSTSGDLLQLAHGEGGCSAKFPLHGLRELMSRLPCPAHPRLLVSSGHFDDAGVYKLTEEIAIIETTDFFPPVCSDPYMFGQIAAANALSDIYAMGGEVLTVMNIVLFPADKPLEMLGEILRGSHDKVSEAGGLVVGGHTINDAVPKFGLAVTGIVHPDKVIANSGAKHGDALVLCKPLGTGIIMAAERLGLVEAGDYQAALDSMTQLNRPGAAIMQELNVSAATDITGFGLLGHALNIARGSSVTLELNCSAVPMLAGVVELAKKGCIPGGAFRNDKFIREHVSWSDDVPWEWQMILADPQTSGGLLICVNPERVNTLVDKMQRAGFEHTCVIGTVTSQQDGEINSDSHKSSSTERKSIVARWE